MKTRYRATIVAMLALALCKVAWAAPFYDPTFGTAGFAIGPSLVGLPSSAFAYANEGLVIDRFNRVLLIATADCGRHTPLIGCAYVSLQRLRVSGEADTGFALRGYRGLITVETGMPVSSALALDGSHRILAALGYWNRIYVRRFHETGNSDMGFGPPIVPVIPGYSSFTIDLEDPFPVIDMAVQSDNKIVIATGSHQPGTFAFIRKITLFRLTAEGLLDTTFGLGGMVFAAVPGGAGFDIATGIAIQPDGRILVTGRSLQPSGEYYGFVARYLPDGSWDLTFGVSGITTVPAPGARRAMARRLALQPGGDIVVAGTVFDASGGGGQAGVFRLKSDGTVDPSFGPPGGGWSLVNVGKTAEIFDLVLQPDGKVVVAGYRENFGGTGSRAAVTVRFNTAGLRDPSWDFDGVSESTAPGFTGSRATAIAIDALHRIVVTGAQGERPGSRSFAMRVFP